MKKKNLQLILILILFSGFNLKKIKYFTYPKYFPKPVYNFKNNFLDSNKIKLGRFLFYDPILSSNNSISCASCHSPYNAFSHSDHALSHGINDQIGTRNAPALFNLAWQKDFMWDGAVNHLDFQPLSPISHPKEMNENFKNIILKLSKSKFYKKWFFKSFGDSIISGERTLKALSQFQITLVSTNSKYDRVKKGNEIFNLKEKKGYEIFLKKCNSCHREPLFSNYQFSKNGLPIDKTLNDYGRVVITKNPEDSLSFKIPSLRNLSYSSPYMHDGRFKTLHEVINHYNFDLYKNRNISPELMNFIPLNNKETVDLISFLRTLNDSSFIYNTKSKFPMELILNAK